MGLREPPASRAAAHGSRDPQARDPHRHGQPRLGHRRVQGELVKPGHPIAASSVRQILHDASLAGVIRWHRASTGSLWRKPNPGQQALLVLAYLCKGETFAALAAGFEAGATTAWRYVKEVVELLAARAPKLRKAIRDAKKAGYACVIADGTLIPIDRVAKDRPSYSGKHPARRGAVALPGDFASGCGLTLAGVRIGIPAR
jgi:hypothetical protein